MALTLLEAQMESGPTKLEAGVVKMFEQESPIMSDLPMLKIDGNAYLYNLQNALPTVAWRAINTAWQESTGSVRPAVERLMILGGEVKVDKFLQDTSPNRAASLKATQYSMKVQAAANEFDRAFLEGDDLVDPNQLVGLRRRLMGNQVILQASGGGTLTTAALDQLTDLVPFDNKFLYMNRTLRRKLSALLNATGGSARIQYTLNSMGQQVERYGGATIKIVEQKGDASTILDFDEDPGDTVSDTASIYCVSYGMDRVHGIWNGAKPVSVEEFGVQQSEPRYLGRIEGYVGMVIHHPRAAARLRGITNT